MVTGTGFEPASMAYEATLEPNSRSTRSRTVAQGFWFVNPWATIFPLGKIKAKKSELTLDLPEREDSSESFRHAAKTTRRFALLDSRHTPLYTVGFFRCRVCFDHRSSVPPLPRIWDLRQPGFKPFCARRKPQP